MNKIVIIGDSHADLFSDDDIITKRGKWVNRDYVNLFDVRWLGPLTYWRICRDKEVAMDFHNGVSYNPTGQKSVSTKIEIGSDVMIVFGEIDIRCHIKNHGGDDYKSLIDDMSSTINGIVESYKDSYNLHLCSITPPMCEDKCISTNINLPFVGDDEYRSEVTLYFNSKLKEICVTNNIGYFDTHTQFSDENNMIDFGKSDKIVHAIKTKELEDYIKEYFGIKN